MRGERAESVEFSSGSKELCRNAGRRRGKCHIQFGLGRIVPQCGARARRVPHLVRALMGFAAMRDEGAENVTLSAGSKELCRNAG